MKFGYATLIAVLAAGILSAPAMAGVSNAKGGTNATRTQDNSVDQSTTQVIGTLTIGGVKGNNDGYGGGKTVYNSGAVKVDYSNPCSAYVQSLIKAAENTVDSLGQRCEEEGGRGSYYGHTVTRSDAGSYDNRSYKLVKDSDWSDVILVGDTDAYNETYAAQGNADRTLVISGNYAQKTVYRVNGSGYVSPIVLDLDNDGKIEASNGKYLPHTCSFDKSTKAVMFDFYGNNFPVMMEWVGPNDGLLVRPHEDGTVDGTCLFGISNGFENGYDELASLDTDKNGALEGAELNGIMVWADKNGNGKVDNGELMNLDDLKITSIGVNHSNFAGSYVCNGKVQKSVDWWPCVLDCRKISVKNI